MEMLSDMWNNKLWTIKWIDNSTDYKRWWF